MKPDAVLTASNDNKQERNNGKVASLRLCVFALAAFLFFGAAAREVRAVDVHEFEQDLPNHLGQQVEIEGRFRSAGAGKLYLVGSQIEFQLGKLAGQVRRSMQAISVEGQLTSGLPKPLFRVDSFRALPDDLERFAQMRERITPGNHQSLFALGRWGRRQAAWYRDRKLNIAAAEASREAFRWATEEAMRLNDADKLLYLAAWGEAVGLAPAQADDLRHQACLLLIKRVPAANPQARLAAAARVRRLLPGTNVPLAGDRIDWAWQYLADPQQVWQRLSRQEQRQAARAMWANLVAGAFEQQAAELDGDKLDALIVRATEELPDRPDTLRLMRLQAVRQRAAAAATLSRAEMLRLRDDLAALDETAASRAVVERWLQAQRQGLDPNDAEGRLLLANEYRELLADQPAAANLLIDALRIAPDLAEASTALAELGYTQRGGIWQAPADKPKEDLAVHADEPPAALGAGVSEATVVARLRRPDRVARVATQNSISEQWIYEGPPRLNIYLRRSTVTGQAFVTRIEGATP